MRNLLAADPTIINLAPSAVSGAKGFEGLSSITVGGILQGAITLVLVVAAVIFFFMLVVGGIKWILSGGDKGQTESARNQITAALIGLVIVFAAWAIANLLGSLFGITIFSGQFTLPTFTGTAAH